MRYLLDTMVLSEPTKPSPNIGVLDWLESIDAEQLYCSAVSLAEFERGSVALESKEPDLARRLRAWADGMIWDFPRRVLDIDIPVARAWGRLSFQLARRDEDVMIGATALLHRCVLVTRNVRDFQIAGLDVINPYVAGGA